MQCDRVRLCVGAEKGKRGVSTDSITTTWDVEAEPRSYRSEHLHSKTKRKAGRHDRMWGWGEGLRVERLTFKI